MKIYDGGSDKDQQLNFFTGNNLPMETISTGNQIFIMYGRSAYGAGKGFSASFEFGKRVSNFNNFSNHIICDYFSHLKENICNNALNLANGLHIVGNWPDGTYCQWLISAQDDDSYVTLEIQNLHVKLT